MNRMMHGQGDAIARIFGVVKANLRVSQAAPTVIHQTASKAEELARFATLRDQGVLNDEEFGAMKVQILDL